MNEEIMEAIGVLEAKLDATNVKLDAILGIANQVGEGFTMMTGGGLDLAALMGGGQ